jgi:hypothetical protein
VDGACLGAEWQADLVQGATSVASDIEGRPDTFEGLYLELDIGVAHG